MYLEIGRSESFIHSMITDSRSYDPKSMKESLEFANKQVSLLNTFSSDKVVIFSECKSVDEQECFSCVWSTMKSKQLFDFFNEVEAEYNRSKTEATEIGTIPDEFLGKF